MWKTSKAFLRLRKDERAATAVEYGLIASLIVIAMLTALSSVATETAEMWGNVSARVAASG